MYRSVNSSILCNAEENCKHGTKCAELKQGKSDVYFFQIMFKHCVYLDYNNNNPRQIHITAIIEYFDCL